MRLKELRLKGFKSFANETRIGFEEQVVGVVGPNGAGKSNIVDAVRWVLGEQKGKDLRTDNQLDVIFNGTASRKKSTVAEVYLVFDNTKNIIPTDYKQVEIGRVLNRSGDSEYLLNGTRCRRKDILNLFIDTGIGSNSYAIIQLGMVDDILFDKENARHRMFEQAAGISKFKVRKRETMLKLKATQADLERIKDILHELEGNMASLEKQAKRTKRYYELKEEYKTLSINLSANNYHTKSNALKGLKKSVSENEEAYRTLNAKLIAFESNLEKTRTENITKEQTLSESQKKFNNLNDVLRTKENEKQLNEKEFQFAKDGLTKAKTTIENLTGEISIITAELKPLKEEKEKQDTTLMNESQSFKEVEENYLKSKKLLDGIQGDEESKLAVLQSFEKKVFDYEKEIVVTENDVNRTKSIVENLFSQIAEHKNQDVNFSSGYQELLKKEKELEEKHAFHEKTQEDLKNRIKEIDVSVENSQSELTDLNRSLDSKQNEYDLIKSMIDNLEGFPESTKFLMEKWKKTPILSNIIDVESEFKSALETYLQPFINHFIVGDYNEAIEAVKLLDGAQKGKAQFFILNRITSEQTKKLTPPKNAIPAIDLVKVDNKYQKLINKLLANVFFVEEWDEQYFNELETGATVLDKRGGWVINRSQVIGGSVGLFEGKKLGREKTLQKLDKEIEKLKSKSESISEQTLKLKTERAELETTFEGQKVSPVISDLDNVKAKKIQLETQIGNLANVLAQVNSQIQSNEKSIAEFETKLVESRANRDKASAELTKFKSEREQVSGELEKRIEDARILTEKYNEANISLLKFQNAVESLNQDIGFKEERLNRLIQEQKENQDESKKLEEKIAACDGKAEKLVVELKEFRSKKQAMLDELNESEQNYFSERSSINELETETQKHRKLVGEKQILINEQKSEMQNYQFEISAINERLSIEFQLDKEAIKTLLENSVDEKVQDGLDEKVVKLRRRLENYGEINPLAVQAYDEVMERFELIAGQRDDILAAETTLLETIEEIEGTASEMFLEAFNKVNEYFAEVFRGLFTEDDTAEIILTDPENPLESNIEIIAKPKGKRPSTLKQLSGGERTLTATALLFSLYLLKPAPFCIFDEVDAPLDDSNILKFVKLIKEFSKESQFVIITHNKSTMAAVDTLYGVYMQEKGISGVTQVDFRQYEHEDKFQMANVN